MSSMIYVIEVNGTIRYVGSCYEHRFVKRQEEHVKRTKWLQGAIGVSFRVIEHCSDENRFVRESFHWKRLIDEGFVLENKRDPKMTYRPITSEIIRIVVETKRRKREAKMITVIPKLRVVPKWSKIACHKGAIITNSIPWTEARKSKLRKPKPKEIARRQGEGVKQAIVEKWQIVAELGCSFSEAGKIRKERR